MIKKGISYGVILIQLICGLQPTLSAKDEDFIRGVFKMENLCVEIGADIIISKHISIQPMIGFPLHGGIFYSGEFVLRAGYKKINPFLTLGLWSYNFKGSSSHDADEGKGYSIGGGIEVNLKNKECIIIGFRSLTEREEGLWGFMVVAGFSVSLIKK
jgi:hypothetical protein